MAAFAAAHPEFAPAMKVITSSPMSSDFANASYNSISAFRFVNAAGVARPVRWTIAATEPFAPDTAERPKNQDKNYLFDDLIARLSRAPLQWHLIVTIGQPGDATNDPTIPWPRDRERSMSERLTIDRAETEAPGNCRDINFDPLGAAVGHRTVRRSSARVRDSAVYSEHRSQRREGGEEDAQ